LTSLFCVSAQGAYIYVDGDYTGNDSDGSYLKPYKTIGAAVGAASDGAEIRVAEAASDYRETVSIDDLEVTIIGWCGGDAGDPEDPENVVIDGEGTRRCLEVQYVAGSGLAIQALTLKRGYAGDHYDGGAVFITASSVTFTDVHILNSRTESAYAGGGLYVESSSVVELTGCTLSGNGATHGAGIYALGSVVTLGDSCTISGNESWCGGGVSANSSTVTLQDDCQVTGNTVTGMGGGVYASGATLTVTECIICGNWTTMGYGAGVYCTGSALTMSDSRVAANGYDVGTYGYELNNTNWYGGGLCLESDTTATLDNVEIYNNGAYIKGGGIHVTACHSCLEYPDVQFVDCTINGNESYMGGGVSIEDSHFGLDGCIIANNDVSKDVFDEPGGRGAGIRLAGGVWGHIRACRVVGNTSWDYPGGGLYASGLLAPFEVSNCLFACNRAHGTVVGQTTYGCGHGGGMLLSSCDHATIFNNTLVSNVVSGEQAAGGAVYVYGLSSYSAYGFCNNILDHNTSGVELQDSGEQEFAGTNNCFYPEETQPSDWVGANPNMSSPDFVSGDSGTWDSVSYDSNTLTTTLTADGSPGWGSLAGCTVDVNTDEDDGWFAVKSNTSSSIEVYGNAEDYAEEDDPYEVSAWNIKCSSPCVDDGVSSYEVFSTTFYAPGDDIDEESRPFDGDADGDAEHDIGMDETQVCYAQHELASGWNLMSVPLDPTDPDVSIVLDKLVTDGGKQDWNEVYHYVPGSGYAQYPRDFSDMATGEGYWILVGTTYDEDVEGQMECDDWDGLLAEGWNVFGHPFNGGVLWSTCEISDGETTLSIDDACSAGWIQSKAFYYEGQYKSLCTSGGDDQYLRPWNAYWFLTYESGLSLIIPDPFDLGERLGGGGFDARRDLGGRDSGWTSKVVFTVEADEGELPDWTMTFGLDSSATDNFDHEYDAFAPPSSPTVEMRMVSYIGGDPQGYGTSDVRDGSGMGGVAESWDYVDILVPGAGPSEEHDVVLTWDLTDAGDYDYTLYDITNEETIDLQTESSYELTTTGKFGAMLALEASPKE